MTVGSDQNSTGQLTFDTSVAFTSDVEVDGDVNGLNLYKDVITTVYNHTVSGYKIIEGSVEAIEGVRMTDGATISGVSFD